jgi:hypothetical protein
VGKILPVPHDAARKGNVGDSRVLGVLSPRLKATAAAANGNRQRTATAKDALTSRRPFGSGRDRLPEWPVSGLLRGEIDFDLGWGLRDG